MREEAPCVEIALSNGMVCLIDASDLELVQQYRWRAACNTKRTSANWYVRTWGKRSDGTMGNFYMHRMLVGAERHQLVDHINGNGLDNRRANLRFATPSQNTVHRLAPFKTDCGYRGVRGRSGAFEAKLCSQFIGRFPTAVQAALAYDRAAVAQFGDFAVPNFPREILDMLDAKALKAFDSRSPK